MQYHCRTTTTGVTERVTMLLSTYQEIVKDAAWLNDEALRTGVWFSLSSMEHHVSALQVNSLLLSPATNNLISLTKKRVDRMGFSEEQTNSLSRRQLCREKPTAEDTKESSLPFTQYNQQFCVNKLILQHFEKRYGCSVLALFGTTDLISQNRVRKISF